MEKLIFEDLSGNLKILTPVNMEKTLDEHAQKSIPNGQPYWIVESNNFPPCGGFSESRELDLTALGVPDGTGGKI